MSEGTAPNSEQGYDPDATIFTDLYPLLYASESPISGSYSKTSELTTAYADAWSGGLRGKSVLDVGCAYGTTTLALTRYAPANIVCIDPSKQMIELLRMLLRTDKNIASYLEVAGAHKVMSPQHLKALQKDLEARRQEVAGGPYKGNVYPAAKDIHRYAAEGAIQSDVAVLNNVFHWPVKQNMSEGESLDTAVNTTLKAIHRVLCVGGVVVLMEPHDFVHLSDPAQEEYATTNSMVGHPLFAKFHSIFNELLKEHHGIDRGIPQTSGLFPEAKWQEWADRAGFELIGFNQREVLLPCDPAAAFHVRLPMVLRNIKITFAEKIALGEETMKRFNEAVTREERAEPIRNQYFWIGLRKR